MACPSASSPANTQSTAAPSARRRAAQRTVYLTDAEFEELHRQQGDNLQVDHELDVADMGIDEQVAAVMKIRTAG